MGHTSVMNASGITILFSAHRLMMFYICRKFHENISKGFLVIERTRNHNGWTDGQTDGHGDYNKAFADFV